ncbi:hypothetical protein [Engelhardtia mirabilis]|uniref:Helix-turn-helix domain protein n=1 Tax=Engelhardtia mirabilis TaxID=2528011 RepID=A0A518BJ67_9BACT|nr:hypothetical protein Pla133_20890 [Planctomycetes bacterium Pla133]QDV01339.1 hypothetical protein Pla86_20890 [Planctomycetes bacterium Pla86]
MSDTTQDFYSFDEALNQLRLKEEELKRLVSEGEIRAFREGDTMKLRRRDVEQLRDELTGGEVVELGTGGDDALVFEDDLEDPGMATEELTAADTIVDEDLEIEEALSVLDEEEFEEVEDEPEEFAASAAPAEEVQDSPLVMAAALGTLLLLILAGPLLVSITTGNMSDFAKSIAGIFTEIDG